MGDLTANLSRWEFSCHCGCGFDTADFALVVVLQDLADHFQTSIHLTGPNRCAGKNRNTPGAAKDSKHVIAQAADVKLKGISPLRVYQYLNKKYPTTFGIGLYWNRVHIDVRRIRARWKKAQKHYTVNFRNHR